MRLLSFYILFFAFSLGLTSPSLALPPELQRQASTLEAREAAQAFLNHSEAKKASPQFVAQVLSQAKGMEAQGIASELYLLKASEGMAKGIPPPKIAPALQQVEERGAIAAQLVDRSVRQGGEKPSLASRRQANLRFQQALLSQVKRQTLEDLIERSASPGQAPSLDRLSAASLAIPRLQKFKVSEREASLWVLEELKQGTSARGLMEMSRKGPVFFEKKAPKPVSPLESQKNKGLKPKQHDSDDSWHPSKGKKWKPFHPGRGRGRGKK